MGININFLLLGGCTSVGNNQLHTETGTESYNATEEWNKDGQQETAYLPETERNTQVTEPAFSLRIGTYNIKNGSMVEYDMSMLASDITALDLDVVGLQEVDRGTERAGGLDTLKLLAEAAEYPYYRFAKAIDYQGGAYGTAILSRYPITDFEVIPLETDEGIERRSLSHAILEINDVQVDFFNTHLSYESKSLRSKQFTTIAEKTEECSAMILTGDFNTDKLLEFWRLQNVRFVNRGEYGTLGSIEDGAAIDNIILSQSWQIMDAGMVRSNHSDHKLLWAEIGYLILIE